jgi:hypothetical protein
MQKVVGSSPIIRFRKTRSGGFFVARNDSLSPRCGPEIVWTRAWRRDQIRPLRRVPSPKRLRSGSSKLPRPADASCCACPWVITRFWEFFPARVRGFRSELDRLLRAEHAREDDVRRLLDVELVDGVGDDPHDGVVALLKPGVFVGLSCDTDFGSSKWLGHPVSYRSVPSAMQKFEGSNPFIRF